MKMDVFWVIVLCSLVEVYRYFKALTALMMVAARTS
jgi:hypothetical protein